MNMYFVTILPVISALGGAFIGAWANGRWQIKQHKIKLQDEAMKEGLELCLESIGLLYKAKEGIDDLLSIRIAYGPKEFKKHLPKDSDQDQYLNELIIQFHRVRCKCSKEIGSQLINTTVSLHIYKKYSLGLLTDEQILEEFDLLDSGEPIPKKLIDYFTTQTKIFRDMFEEHYKEYLPTRNA